MHYQIMVNKGTNLWAFYDEQGFMYAAETEVEMAEKVRELAKTTPLDNIKVVAVLDTETVIKVESLCPEPDTPPDNPENPDTPTPDNPDNPENPDTPTPDTPTDPDNPPDTGETTDPVSRKR